MPIRKVYGDVGAIGELAAASGIGAYNIQMKQIERQDFWNRFNAEQQLVAGQRQYNVQQAEIQQRAFAMQTAAKSQPQMPQLAVGPRVITQNMSPTPEQVRLEAFSSQVQNMLKRGTIQQGQGDEVMANFLAGSRSPFGSLERGGAPQQQDGKSEISRVRAERAAAEAQLEQLEKTMDPGGVLTSEQRSMRDELWNRVVSSHEQEASIYGSRTGALGGGGGQDPDAGGKIYYNPSTGEKIQLVNGKWVPVQ